MKFAALPLAALALLVSSVAGQNNTGGDGELCTSCLQTALMALPLCKGLNITIGNFNPGESPAFAVCLCSSIDGAWVDTCQDTTKCGPDIVSFKASYKANMEQVGLQCNGTTPTFIPGPTAPIEPSTTIGTTSPTGGADSDNKSFGVKNAEPSGLFIKTMGAMAFAVAIGASLI
ncbi:hypothetical protein BGX27_010749 [Mortierella sp. AM989]|nr:hypothetical protein BGX27_010749 [Mortierella sp. AM989]